MASTVFLLMDLLLALVSGFLLCSCFCYLVLRFFPKWDIMDRPQDYGMTRDPIPYPGGIAIVLAFSILLPFFFPVTKELIAFMVGGLFLATVNFIDDRKRLPAWMRLGSHVIAGLIIVIGGIGITHISNPLGGIIPLDTFALPFTLNDITYHFSLWADLFTILWLVLIINSINWLDSIPGLTSGIGTIGALTLFALSMLLVFSPSTTPMEKESAYHIALMALLFGSICLAFVRFDFFPARMIIGDTGTMYIGYVLAILAIFSGGKIATTFMVLGFPILDAFWVILRRVLSGQSPFKGDLKHFPHRLMNVGFSERQAALLMYAICGLFGLIALLLLQEGPHSKLIAILAMLGLMVIVATYILVLERKKEQE